MKFPQTIQLSVAVTLMLLCASPPAHASLFGEVLSLILKEIPNLKKTARPKGAEPLWPPAGMSRVETAIYTLPEDARPSAQKISNAYVYLYERAGITEAKLRACPACFPATPRLPDQAVRAARLMLENDGFLAGKAAGNASFGALSSFSASTGNRTTASSVGVKKDRAEVVAALAEAMGGLRDGALEEAEFKEALASNLRKLADKENKPKSTFGLDEIGYDAEKHTLTFKARFNKTTVKIASLDVRRYVDRMTGLSFGAGGIYLLRPEPEAQTEPPLVTRETLEAAKAEAARVLAKAETACKDEVSFACSKLSADSETSQQIHDAVWAEALLERLKNI